MKRFESAWATSKVEALLELLTDDVVLIQPGMPSTHGKEAAREVFTRLLRLIPICTSRSTAGPPATR